MSVGSTIQGIAYSATDFEGTVAYPAQEKTAATSWKFPTAEKLAERVRAGLDQAVKDGTIGADDVPELRSRVFDEIRSINEETGRTAGRTPGYVDMSAANAKVITAAAATLAGYSASDAV